MRRGWWWLASLLVLAAGCDDGGGGSNAPKDAEVDAEPADAGPDPGTTLTMRTLGLGTAEPSKVALTFQVLAGPELVGDLRAEDFTILENDAPLARSEAAVRLRQREAAGLVFEAPTVLLLDLSKSVFEAGGLDHLKAAARLIVDRLRPEQTMQLVTFADAHQVRLAFTDDKDDLHAAIDGLRTFDAISTNLHGSIIESLKMWEDSANIDNVARAPFVRGLLIVLTDGQDTAAIANLDEVLQIRQSKRVVTVGVGPDLDPDKLASIGNGASHVVADFPDLPGAMADVQESIDRIFAESDRIMNSVYELTYCSPKRNGEHELTIAAQRNDRSGVVRGLFNSNGFTSSTPWGVGGAVLEGIKRPRLMVARDQLYVVGERTVHFAQPDDQGLVDRWQPTERPPRHLTHYGLATNGRHVYVTGGQHEGTKVVPWTLYARVAEDGTLQPPMATDPPPPLPDAGLPEPPPRDAGPPPPPMPDGGAGDGDVDAGAPEPDAAPPEPEPEPEDVLPPGEVQSGIWTHTTPLPRPRWQHTLVAHGNYLYALGGVNDLDEQVMTVYVARIRSDGHASAWHATTPLPTPITEGSAVVVGDRLYVAGTGTARQRNVLFARIGGDGNLGPWTATTALPGAGPWRMAATDSTIYLVRANAAVDGFATFRAGRAGGGTLEAWTRLEQVAATGDFQGDIVTYDGRLYLAFGDGGRLTQVQYSPLGDSGAIGPVFCTP